MKILVDENVCASLAKVLREESHEVFSLVESDDKGLSDNEVWSIACSGPFLLITRDYHFTNSLRFVPTRCLGIIFHLNIYLLRLILMIVSEVSLKKASR